MKLKNSLLVIAGICTLAATESASNDENRPLIHLTPNEGWMNDPNGLWYDAKEELWHAYYQYYPEDTNWGLPLDWGHSVSKDLSTWNDTGVAIRPARNDSGAYSGSMVIDYNNTSGFFNSSVDPRQRVIAMWTYNTPESESQYISYSIDGGFSFIEYAQNPVIDINATNFRDPKAIWHEESNKWIVTIAHSQKYEILIYSSPNMKDWTLESSFSHAGFLGYQYECPGLVKVPVVKASNNEYVPSDLTFNTTFSENDNQEEAWVMILSINPGNPLGGSANQYFLGDFNGTHFTPFTPQTRFLDFGKDFYAFQTFFNAPGSKDVLGIAWASNWQYCAYVPTEKWRSSMSLVRNLTIQEYAPNPETVELNLNSAPVFDRESLIANQSAIRTQNTTLKRTSPISLNLPQNGTGVFDFSLTWSVNTTAYKNSLLADFSLYLIGNDGNDEYLRIGYEGNSGAFFLDRGHSNVDFVSQDPFFTNKLSTYLEPYKISEAGVPSYKVYGVVDRNLIELFFNDGSSTMTNLFFLTDGNYINGIDIKTSVDNCYNIEELTVQQFGV